jgi:hypothetical protein
LNKDEPMRKKTKFFYRKKLLVNQWERKQKIFIGKSSW